MQLSFNKKFYLCFLLALIALACTDEVSEGTRPSGVNFSTTVDAENKQKITFKNLTEKAEVIVWTFGDGSPVSYEQNPVHEYETGGTYQVTLNARSKGGSVTKNLTLAVEGNGPPNLIDGGDFADQTKWTVINTGSTATATEFANGALKFSNGTGTAQTNIIAYSTAEVEAGKAYKFSAKVKGSGASNTWFETFLSSTEPTAGADFSLNKYIALNTWSGCATSAFNGNLSDIGCDGPGKGKNGIISFEETGTIYVVLKTGSWDGNMGTDGITIDDVKLVETDHPDNLIEGGGMADASAWTVSSTGGTQTNAEIANGVLKFSNGGGPAQTNVVVWTTVEVEAEKEYKFSAFVKGAGASNTWLEILFGKTAPTAGSDYSDGLYTGLNTWDGCAKTAFSGDLATLACKAGAAGTGKNGVITFAESGTIYVAIKAGSWDGTLGTGGIIVDQVQLLEVE